MTTYKFRLGGDPLKKLDVDHVKKRIVTLSSEYPDAVMAGKKLFSTQITVWAVTFDEHNVPYFASVKMLGYAKSVTAYLKAKNDNVPMTGIDAVTALRKRGFINCEANTYPELVKLFKKWLDSFGGLPKTNYRFIIHRGDLAKISDNIRDIADTYRRCSNIEKEVLEALVAEDELASIF